MCFVRSFFIFALFVLSACNRVPDVDDSTVRPLVASRLDKQVCWVQNASQDQALKEHILALLTHPLSCEVAVQLALLQNPKMQQAFENLGIAQADLVAAGLLQNPIFQGLVRFPDRASASVNTEFAIIQNFLDIFLLPLRKKIAKASFEQTKYSIVQTALDIAFDVEQAFYTYLAEKKKLLLLDDFVLAREIALDLALEQKKVGNIHDLELQMRKDAYLQASLLRLQCKNKLLIFKEELTKLLGVKSVSWESVSDFPSDQARALHDDLEKNALENRLELKVLRLELERLQEVAKTKQWWSYTNPSIGISSEKEDDGVRVTGPTLALGLPFFNDGYVERRRFAHLFQQTQDKLKEKEIEVLSDLRKAVEVLHLATQLKEGYTNQILVLQEQKVTASIRQYNVMGISVFRLLQAKEEEIQSKIDAAYAFRDFFVAKVLRNKAVGYAL